MFTFLAHANDNRSYSDDSGDENYLPAEMTELLRLTTFYISVPLPSACIEKDRPLFLKEFITTFVINVSHLSVNMHVFTFKKILHEKIY